MVAILILGLVGVPMGSPMPAVESTLLAAGVHFLPKLLEDSPHYAQNITGIVLLAWMATFAGMLIRFTRYHWWYGWFNFSFLVLFAKEPRDPGEHGPSKP